jgi:cell wall-associated NlpC family hydrolase
MSEIWTPDRIAIARAEAESWLGTRHHNRLAIKGVGVDCIKFVYEVLIAAGILERAELGGYATTIGLHETTHKLKRAFKSCARVLEVPPVDPQFGDIVVFKEGKFSAHTGIVIDGRIFHALSNNVVTASNFVEWGRHLDCFLRVESIGLIGDPMAAAQIK